MILQIVHFLSYNLDEIKYIRQRNQLEEKTELGDSRMRVKRTELKFLWKKYEFR